MIEWIGVLVIVAVIVAGVLSLGLGAKISGGLKHTVSCVFQTCPASGTPGSGGQGPTQPVAGVTPTTTTTPAATDVDDPVSVCGEGGTPLTGPVVAGGTRPCVSTTTGAQCTPQAVPPRLPTCVSSGSATTTTPTTPTPVPQEPLPTPDSPWTAFNDGGNSCPVGYDFHTYDGQPWCANSTLDLDPGKLEESPWETNRNDYEPGAFNLTCGSSNTSGCSLPDPTPWADAQRYYACYNSGGEDCDPPKYLPVVGLKDPSDDPDHPTHGYQVFPYGKPQEEAYDTASEAIEKFVEGLHDTYEQKELLEERLDDAALARVSSEAWVEEYEPNGDDAPDSDPADGDGEDDGE